MYNTVGITFPIKPLLFNLILLCVQDKMKKMYEKELQGVEVN